MKHAISAACCLAILSLLSFDTKHPKNHFLPPNTVRVNDTLYFDKTEISNLNWREYIYWSKREFGDSSAEYLKTIPDTLIWDELVGDNYREHYHDMVFNDHPVVGVSHEQAMDFCKWRTDRVKQLIEVNPKYGKKIQPRDFQYRLPTKAEWEEVARADFSEKTKKQLNKKKWKGVALYNAIRYDSTYTGSGNGNPDAKITAPVYMYMPNHYGINNLFGNVGEMISEPGIYKGGGWNNRMDELKPERDYPYQKPEAWIGFRCVCVVKWN